MGAGKAAEPEGSRRRAPGETLRDSVNDSSEPPLEQPGSAGPAVRFDLWREPGSLPEVIEPKVVGPGEQAPAFPLRPLDSRRTREELSRSAEDEASKLRGVISHP